MGVASRANRRLRQLGYRRAEAAVVTVAEDPAWLLVSGTHVRAAAVPKDEVLGLVDRLPPRVDAGRRRLA